MSKSESKRDSKENRKEVFKEFGDTQKTCPACGLQTTVILDHKKNNDSNKIYICLTCGHVFEITQSN